MISLPGIQGWIGRLRFVRCSCTAGVAGLLGAALLASSASAEARLASSVTRFGITWTFSTNAVTGVYANGDPWVAGPVTITAITPACVSEDGWIRNGTMVNPAVGGDQAYDNTMDHHRYRAELNVAPGAAGKPLALSSGSVVSSVSQSARNQRPQLQEIEILTVVESAPADGAFRPPVVGADKTSPWNKGNLDYSILRKLPPVAHTPALETVEAYFQRPWLEHHESVWMQHLLPVLNQPQYGRDMANRTGLGMLMLHLDFPDARKETLYIRLVQYGIDVYGLVRTGKTYLSGGGLNIGRKMPMLLAGAALRDTNILAYADAARHFAFQEDKQMFYVTQADVDRARYTKDNRPRAPYTPAMIGLAEWGEQHDRAPQRDGSNWSAYYRFVGGSVLPHVLMARLTGLEDAWNWPATFDYIDRYWEMEKTNPTYRGTNDIHPFARAMWEGYRRSPLKPVPSTAPGKDRT